MTELAAHDIEPLLTNLFEVYAVEGCLSLGKLRQLAKDSGLELQVQAVDLAFCSATHHRKRMLLAEFMEAVPRLATAKWPHLRRKEAVMKVLNDYFLPMYVQAACQQTSEIKEPDVLPVLQQAFEMLRSIYRAFFTWESSDAPEPDIAEQSESSFFTVLSDFALSPQLLSRVEAASLWRDLLQCKDRLADFSHQVLPSESADEGKVFTLGLFVTSLYLISESVTGAASRQQKVIEVVHRMERSSGFAGLHKSELQDASELTSSEVLSLRLLPVFQRYCFFGSPMNANQLGSSQFVKLFRDAQVVLSPSDLDLIYSKLAGSRKMDFPAFLKAIRLVARKAFPHQSLDSAVTQLADGYLLRLDTPLAEAGHVTKLGILLQDPDVVEILGLVHGSMLYYYHYYADPRGLLSYTGFIHFCKDFSLFPGLCPKPKLLSIFSALASIFSSTGQPEASLSKTRSMYVSAPLQSDCEVIDEHLFLEAIALISQEIALTDDPLPPHRLCFLFEKLSHSGGPEKVMQSLGHNRSSTDDFLSKLRSKFGHYLRPGPPKPVSLWDLLSSTDD